MIQIYNSLTRRKQPLTPRVAGRLGLYVCGMTVYDYCHLGHARVMVVFDTVVRYLRASGLEVTYVRNITDIDDKIIRRAANNGEPVAALTARFVDAMHEDERLLAVLPPDIEPRATGHITTIVDMITTLIARGCAYHAENGDVYYAVHCFANYGALSGESPDELRAGARIEPDEAKRDPLDFVLWKATKPGEPRWDSPWGPGRPGWHIECSAMSTQCLGNTFDIHAGGMDLKFPHHENEIAQSEAATGTTFACLWMHNGYVQVDKEKMSKSLGNFFTIREILDTDTNRRRMGEVIRFMILASHYRRPLNYSDETLANARAGLTRLYLALDKAGAGGDHSPIDSLWLARFRAAMDDDFNTAEALAVLFDIARELNRALDAGDIDRQHQRAAELRYGAGVLGLLSLAPAEFLGRQGASLADTELAGRRKAPPASAVTAIDQLITDRSEARRQRDWARADRIRAQLTEQGVIVEDKPGGRSVWRRQ